MSCFESSTFLKDPNVIRKDLLIKACKRLGWQYELQANNELVVYNTSQNSRQYGEYALKIKDNKVIYNIFYFQGRKLVQQLKQQLHELNVSYAKTTVISAFEEKGFAQERDYDFIPTPRERKRFFMVGRTRDLYETEKRTKIQFTILYDGTVISDSDYIPKDLHDLADEAMATIDAAFGSHRKEGVHIKRKKIPSEYKHKAYCSVKKELSVFS